MLLTENEARRRMICPLMTRAGETMWCNGTDCPMWRWSDKHIDAYVDMNGQPTLIRSDETRLGYCGLAGKPEES